MDRVPIQPKPLEWIGSSKKKSKTGIATPKSDMDLIRERLKVAARRAKELKDEQA